MEPRKRERETERKKTPKPVCLNGKRNAFCPMLMFPKPYECRTEEVSEAGRQHDTAKREKKPEAPKENMFYTAVFMPSCLESKAPERRASLCRHDL